MTKPETDQFQSEMVEATTISLSHRITPNQDLKDALKSSPNSPNSSTCKHLPPPPHLVIKQHQEVKDDKEEEQERNSFRIGDHIGLDDKLVATEEKEKENVLIGAGSGDDKEEKKQDGELLNEEWFCW